ncbi:hypothetical protein BC834DRAFT_295586 [Gloeopeniophorella convolvens]|nr:hypothetical protein BC834DRAFT_295586 [Gloeopeniophorella convolvens]
MPGNKNPPSRRVIWGAMDWFMDDLSQDSWEFPCTATRAQTSHHPVLCGPVLPLRPRPPTRVINASTRPPPRLLEMALFDVISLAFSLFGVSSLFVGIPYAFPRKHTQSVATQLDSAWVLLDESIRAGYIANAHIFMTELASIGHKSAVLRSESNRANTTAEQFKLALRGRTCKLLVLAWRIRLVRSRIELIIDEDRLGLRPLIVAGDEEVDAVLGADALPPTRDALPPAQDILPPANIVQPVYPPPVHIV